MNKQIGILFFVVFLLVGGVNAITINEPRQGLNYYVNLIDFDVNWDTGVNKCQYALNNQTNKTFSCQNTFLVDIPYHSGQANITLYGTDGSDVVTDKTVTFNIIDDNNTIKGVVGFGVVLFAIFVSFIMFFMVFVLHYIEREGEQDHSTLKMIFMLLGLAMLFPAYNAINILIRMYIHLDSLSDVMSPFVFTWIFIVVVFYVFIYIIYKSIMLFDSKKHKTGEYDED